MHLGGEVGHSLANVIRRLGSGVLPESHAMSLRRAKLRMPSKGLGHVDSMVVCNRAWWQMVGLTHLTLSTCRFDPISSNLHPISLAFD